MGTLTNLVLVAWPNRNPACGHFKSVQKWPEHSLVLSVQMGLGKIFFGSMFWTRLKQALGQPNSWLAMHCAERVEIFAHPKCNISIRSLDLISSRVPYEMKVFACVLGFGRGWWPPVSTSGVQFCSEQGAEQCHGKQGISIAEMEPVSGQQSQPISGEKVVDLLQTYHFPGYSDVHFRLKLKRELLSWPLDFPTFSDSSLCSPCKFVTMK